MSLVNITRRDTTGRRRSQRIAGFGVLLVCAAGATQAADSGPYLGADLGGAYAPGDTTWRISPSTVLTGSSLSEKDVVWSLTAGYRFSQYLAVETGYVDLGRLTASVTDRSNATGAQASLRFSAKGETVAVVGTLPFGNWEPYLKAGVLFANTDLTVSGANGAIPIDDRVSSDTRHGFVGVGIGYNFGTHWRLQLGLTNYLHVGSRDRINGPDVHALQVGVTYRF